MAMRFFGALTSVLLVDYAMAIDIDFERENSKAERNLPLCESVKGKYHAAECCKEDVVYYEPPMKTDTCEQVSSHCYMNFDVDMLFSSYKNEDGTLKQLLIDFSIPARFGEMGIWDNIPEEALMVDIMMAMNNAPGNAWTQRDKTGEVHHLSETFFATLPTGNNIGWDLSTLEQFWKGYPLKQNAEGEFKLWNTTKLAVNILHNNYPTAFSCWINTIYESTESYMVATNGKNGYAAVYTAILSMMKPSGGSYDRIILPRSGETAKVRLQAMGPFEQAYLDDSETTIQAYLASKKAMSEAEDKFTIAHKFSDVVRCK